MKVLLLADASSAHTVKWALGLAKKNIDVYIFSLSNVTDDCYSNFKNIKIYNFTFSYKLRKSDDGNIKKLTYLRVIPTLRKLIKQIQPDIIHAHYASSYGLIGSLVNFHPYIISVYGNDIYVFPKKSIFHKLIIKFNLKKADKILSTSNCMAIETKKYTEKEIIITPFGIDIDIFKPIKIKGLFEDSDIVIGTVKALEEKYGIEYLIKAFYILKNKYSYLPFKLLIVGGGLKKDYYINLTKDLKIQDSVIFTGYVPPTRVVEFHNMIHIFVAVSIFDSESFGVAVLEASACEKPVIVSDVGGLPEVVLNNVTGIIVPKMDEQKTFEAIEKLVFNSELRTLMGKAGRQWVIEKYNFSKNIEQMIEIYYSLL